jgi:hypothetical protein
MTLSERLLEIVQLVLDLLGTQGLSWRPDYLMRADHIPSFGVEIDARFKYLKPRRQCWLLTHGVAQGERLATADARPAPSILSVNVMERQLSNQPFTNEPPGSGKIALPI